MHYGYRDVGIVVFVLVIVNEKEMLSLTKILLSLIEKKHW